MSAARTLRALPTMLKVGFSAALAYRSEMLVWILTTNMPLVMMALWTSVAKDAPVGRFGQGQFSAYFLATLIVRLSTSAWVVWEMNFEIRAGTLAMRLLRPVHPFVSYATDNWGAMPFRMALTLPMAIFAVAWLGTSSLTHDPVQWAMLPLALLGAWAVTFCVMVVIGTLGLFWESSLSVFDVWIGAYFLLSGYLLPIELFPPRLFAVVRWLPFRFVLSFPVEVMLGLEGRASSLRALGVQWLYVALFMLAADRMWRLGLRRFAAYGG